MALPQCIVALPQTEKVGLSFPSYSLLLLLCPLTPPQRCSSTCIKPPHTVKKAPGLASDSFHTQQSPNLPREQSNLSLLASFAPAPPPFPVLFVTVQAACFTSRMGHLGEGARAGAGRRRDMMAQEERGRREAEAYFMAYTRGRRRRGH